MLTTGAKYENLGKVTAILWSLTRVELAKDWSISFWLVMINVLCKTCSLFCPFYQEYFLCPIKWPSMRQIMNILYTKINVFQCCLDTIDQLLLRINIIW